MWGVERLTGVLGAVFAAGAMLACQPVSAQEPASWSRTGKTVPVSNGAFSIDGARDHALYYEVVF